MKMGRFGYERKGLRNQMNMYILIYINCTERVWGMHVWWNYPLCIRRRNKECLPFNTTLVLRGFIPGFSVTKPQIIPNILRLNFLFFSTTICNHKSTIAFLFHKNQH